MSAFLLLLVKLNLAMGAAIILVSLLRRPLRLLFGAPIAYAIWFLVPIASLAILFPPRLAAPALAPVAPMHESAAAVSVTGHIAHSALHVTQLLTEQSVLMPPAITAPPQASAHAMPNTALLLFAAWALGTLLMALYLTRLQLRFSAAVRLREAGPAVLGFLRPRIVTPDSFQERFTPQEQAAILAHERVHLARQDARINALTAFLRCLCWFNPLIHLGARWLRIDQELACDASVVAGAISRGDYAKALLKSQMVVTALPLGCNWPGSQHPLVDRIALLKRKPPGAARRLAGMILVLLAAASTGLGAWAAQPAVAAKPMAARQRGMALAMLPAIVAAPSRTAIDTGPGQPVVDANPTGNGNGVNASMVLHAPRAVSAEPAPASVQMPSGVIEAQNTVGTTGGLQASAPTEAPAESVTVTGSRRVLHLFAKTFATPTMVTGKMARWEHRLCPIVVGQKPNYARYLTQRVQVIALAAGAPVNTEASCTPNIEIVFTTTPQDLLDAVSKDAQHYLGYFSSVAEKKALATVTRPIQAWYATESTDIKGKSRLDTGRSIVGGTTLGNSNDITITNGDIVSNSTGPALTDIAPIFASSGSRLDDGIHTGFRHILVVIDSTKLAGQDIVPLADYISMLALTQINAPDACQNLPSIVNRMAPDCSPPVDGLTKYDLAYLQALYHMTTGRNMVAQWDEIGDLMTDRLAEIK